MTTLQKIWMMMAAAGLFGVSIVEAQQEFLDVNFSNDYQLGPVDGQGGGVSGGAWTVSGPTYEVVASPDSVSGQVLLSSREGQGMAQVPLIKPLQIGSPRIYFAVDIWRSGPNSQGYWTLVAAPAGTNTGIGIQVPKGEAPVQIFTASEYAVVPTEFTVGYQSWHRFEIEADGVLKTCNVYVQVEGDAERKLIAKEVPWTGKNSAVKLFRLSQPSGKSESKMYTNNIRVLGAVEFPYARDLNVDLAARIPQN